METRDLGWSDSLRAFPHTHGMRYKVQEGKYLAVPAVLKVLSTGGMVSSPCTEGKVWGISVYQPLS